MEVIPKMKPYLVIVYPTLCFPTPYPIKMAGRADTYSVLAPSSKDAITSVRNMVGDCGAIFAIEGRLSTTVDDTTSYTGVPSGYVATSNHYWLDTSKDE